jgi:hypothetical protein
MDLPEDRHLITNRWEYNNNDDDDDADNDNDDNDDDDDDDDNNNKSMNTFKLWNYTARCIVIQLCNSSRYLSEDTVSFNKNIECLKTRNFVFPTEYDMEWYNYGYLSGWLRKARDSNFE